MNEKTAENNLDEDDDLPPQLVDLEGTEVPENEQTTSALKVPITIVTGELNSHIEDVYLMLSQDIWELEKQLCLTIY